MIVSQTPYRVSFAGGGTDLPAFYREEWGAVLSTAIDRYMYVTVGTRFDSTIRVAYSTTEVVESAAALKHTLVREALAVQLSSMVEFDVVGMAEDAGDGLAAAVDLTPDVVVMDIDMPGMICFDAAERIKSRLEEVKVIFLSSALHDHYIESALKIDAYG